MHTQFFKMRFLKYGIVAVLCIATSLLSAQHVGIGTTDPDTTLHIIGSLKMQDGNEADGYLMVSDAEGTATWVDPLTVKTDTQSVIADSDGNTRIDTEQSPDENVIRFIMNGTEFFVMDSGRLEIFNTSRNVYLGEGAGADDPFTFEGRNVAVGTDAMHSNIDGRQNAALGDSAMYANVGGDRNAANGHGAMKNNVSGFFNTAVGFKALESNVTGTHNTAIGAHADVSAPDLINATAIGANAVVAQDSSVVLGNNARVGIGTSSPEEMLHVEGTIEVDNKIQANNNSGLEFATDEGTTRMKINDNGLVTVGSLSDPGGMELTGNSTAALTLQASDDIGDLGLAYRNSGGWYTWDIYRTPTGPDSSDLVIAGGITRQTVPELDERMRILSTGQVTIGTPAPATGYMLSVGGKIICEEMKIRLQNMWPDYVFAENYERLTLDQLRTFIHENRHLPNIPSARQVAADDGIDIGEMQRLSIEKLEELTLYIFDLEEKVTKLEAENARLKELLNTEMAQK